MKVFRPTNEQFGFDFWHVHSGVNCTRLFLWH